MNVGLEHYLILSSILFVLGLLGLVLRRNILVLFMSIELLLNAANLAFVAFSKFRGDLNGHVISFFVIAVAAAEAAIGLALVISLFRNRTTVMVDQLDVMKN
ncbi:MAG: NADH-quinone oxidoreductase subunit NuoK [Deltaproteobacteria bacterium]|nr:NADH-quinone oxidoreductase subunit NuoK [Deltaproteobacteria bacterium]